MHSGQCECGGVEFDIALDELRAPSACHCTQCRRTSGHVWAGSTVMNDELTLTKAQTLAWFRSSDHAERGFCKRCGASLFYRPIDSDHVSVAMGAITGPTGTQLKRHIFVADKGDYYDIACAAPQEERY